MIKLLRTCFKLFLSEENFNHQVPEFVSSGNQGGSYPVGVFSHLVMVQLLWFLVLDDILG